MNTKIFERLELDKFEREIFAKLVALDAEGKNVCKKNIFYVISKFKFDKEKFIKALKKREYLYNDLEFSEDGLSFRMIDPKPETVEQAYDKERELARNMYLVHQWHDETLELIKSDPNFKAEQKIIRQSYAKKKK